MDTDLTGETATGYAAALATLPAWNVDQLAAVIGAPVTTIEAQLTHQRKPEYTGPVLRSFRIGRRRFFRREAALDWIRELEALEMGGAA
ncbi:hypothetical protein [Aliiruegeria sabulilitoris]|uniref:hypothetical protein n=1 Tax=Aliiruegeria sabulilitoris TaxID=1510458 RepID=UPI000830CC9D|nr:hypothetical protein [Aliiruegeria sabulilitoris]NDR57395.1 hypothetical protein [Pseudoruegeria sp. M32A2M]